MDVIIIILIIVSIILIYSIIRNFMYNNCKTKIGVAVVVAEQVDISDENIIEVSSIRL
jgi:hypothetical protein